MISDFLSKQVLNNRWKSIYDIFSFKDEKAAFRTKLMALLYKFQQQMSIDRVLLAEDINQTQI